MNNSHNEYLLKTINNLQNEAQFKDAEIEGLYINYKKLDDKNQALISQLEKLTRCECEELNSGYSNNVWSCQGCKNAEKIKQMELGK